MKKMLPTKGRILISEPFLSDPEFNRSVILLGQYSDEGAVGFVLNRLLNSYTDELVPDLLNYNFPLYFGGPVEQNTLHFIHTCGDLIEGCEEICEGLYWGGNINSVNDAIDNRLASPENFKFFVGYSGWSPEQLESEIESKSWFVANVPKELLMNCENNDLWKTILKSMGRKGEMIANLPDDPSLN